MKLNDLKLYEEGTIIKVAASSNIKRRLMDIGLVKGSKIKPVLANKTIRAYMIKSSIVAIRKKDTEKIEVKI